MSRRYLFTRDYWAVQRALFACAVRAMRAALAGDLDQVIRIAEYDAEPVRQRRDRIIGRTP